MLVFERNNRLYTISKDKEVQEIYDGSLGQIDKFYLIRDTLLVISGEILHIIAHLASKKWRSHCISTNFISFFVNYGSNTVLYLLYPNLTIIGIEIYDDKIEEFWPYVVDNNEVVRSLLSVIHSQKNDRFIAKFTDNNQDYICYFDEILDATRQRINRFMIIYDSYCRQDSNVELISRDDIYRLYDNGKFYMFYEMIRDNIVKLSSSDHIFLSSDGILNSGNIIIATNVTNFFFSGNNRLIYFIKNDRLLLIELDNSLRPIEILPGGASYIRLPHQSPYDDQLQKNDRTKSAHSR